MKLSTLRNLIAVVCILPLIAIASSAVYAFHVRAQAAEFLACLDRIHVGSTSRGEAEQILRPLRGFEHVGARVIAGKSYSAEEFLFRNRSLRFPGFVAPAHISGLIAFRDGLVIDKEFMFTEDAPPFSVASTWEVAQDVFPTPLQKRTASGLHAQAIRPPAVLSVRVDASASTESRRAAYQFNLDCFTSFSGCSLAPQILPAVQPFMQN